MQGTSGMTTGYISQRAMLQAIQRGDQFVYALITRHGAVKIGVSRDLANRKRKIEFGGTDHFVGFMPGDYQAEQRIHASLTQHRIPGTREYYYPVPEILPAINQMREWMGVRELRRKALPRLAECKFHSRVQEFETRGTPMFQK